MPSRRPRPASRDPASSFPPARPGTLAAPPGGIKRGSGGIRRLRHGGVILADDALRLRIEQTLLRPEATAAEVRAHCEEALRLGFVGVCVVPARVSEAAAVLRGAPVALVTTAGFPHGTSSTDAKAFEAERAHGRGATDVDFVMHPGAAKDGDWDAVAREFAALRAAAPEAVLKAILETGFLTEDEVRRAAACAVEAGLDFVKTSTGYGPRGATVGDVTLLRAASGGRCRVKASGGIRTREQAMALVAAGADRIGTSCGPAILRSA
jgi:deoxyribose-phosphate aldolase